MKTAKLHIEGMSCGHCLNAVNKAIGSVPGARPVQVGMGTALVEFEETSTSPEQIAEAVKKAGYRATPSSS